ncbi:MAG: low molecular weight phosphatase family protein [Agrococcus casei]|uniref:Arsenate reductase n=1 Tax=Agrococcus casei LMG 22410 TaxID=1255656 RepID=A0A1R4ET90_9MICO|nr:phosphotyrosine protein phosphatase [Agrococcus casei]SJM46897.1 Arsenate reductase [Agrococcus casei LMG 22410]
MIDTTPKDTSVLQRTAEQLTERYEGVFTPEMVERYVFESYAALGRTAKVRTYLATTAGHFADSRLRALAQSMGRIEHDRPQVLFVCVQNAGRSQLAAALLSKLAGDQVEIRSAGSLPANDLHPETKQLLDSIGVDADAYPKPLTDDVVRAADYVITMGCGDTCPIYPGKTYLDWDVEDPEGKTAAELDRVMSVLDAKVTRLWNEISAPA